MWFLFLKYEDKFTFNCGEKPSILTLRPCFSNEIAEAAENVPVFRCDCSGGKSRPAELDWREPQKTGERAGAGIRAPAFADGEASGATRLLGRRRGARRGVVLKGQQHDSWQRVIGSVQGARTRVCGERSAWIREVSFLSDYRLPPLHSSSSLPWRRRTRSDPAAASAAPLENKRTSGLGCGCSESGGPYGLIPEIIQARWIPALQGLSGRIWIQHLKLTSNLTARADWNELGTYLCSLHKKQQYNSELFCKHEIWLKQLWIFSNLLNSVFSKINILVSWLSVSVDSFPSVHSNLPVNNEVRGRTSAAHRLTNSKQMWRISHLCC